MLVLSVIPSPPPKKSWHVHTLIDTYLQSYIIIKIFFF